MSYILRILDTITCAYYGFVNICLRVPCSLPYSAHIWKRLRICLLACFYLCTHDQIYNKIMNTIDKRIHKMRYNVQAFSRIIQGWAVGGLDASKSGPSTLCFYGWSLELLVPFIRSSKSSIKSFSVSERHN